MTGQTNFPPIGELPYLLTLPAYGAFWFRLSAEDESEELAPSAPELFTLVQRGAPETLLTGRELQTLEDVAMPAFLGRQPWFRPNRADILSVRYSAAVRLPGDQEPPVGLALFDVTLKTGESGPSLLPLSLAPEVTDDLLPRAIAQVRKFNQVGLVIDALESNSFGNAIQTAALSNWQGQFSDGASVRFTGTEDLAAHLAAARIEARNAPETALDADTGRAVAVGGHLVVRLYRYPRPGPRIEIDAARFLWENGFRNTPRNFGTLVHTAPDGTQSTLIALFAFVRNQGTARSRIAEAVRRELEAAALLPPDAHPDPEAMFGSVARFAQVIGKRTAELHALLGNSTDQRFNAEPYGEAGFETYRAVVLSLIETAFRVLQDTPSRIGNRLLAKRRPLLAAVRAARPMLEGTVQALVHGNMDLSRILVVQDDVILSGLGVPQSSPGQDMHYKRPTLEDLASVIHSFATITGEATDDLAKRFPEAAATLRRLGAEWQSHFQASVFTAYQAAGGHVTPDPELLRLVLIAKAAGDLRNILLRQPARLEWLNRHLESLITP